MSQPRHQYHYDLSKLSAFNEALIYGFECEKSEKNLDPNEYPAESMVHAANQHEDMFDAYYYAQETILKAIQTQGMSIITPENILIWDTEIHKRIARTMAEDHDNPELAGNYSPAQVLRWHQTYDVAHILQLKFMAEKTLVKQDNTYVLSTPYLVYLKQLNKSPNFIDQLTEKFIETSENFVKKLKELKVEISNAKKYVALLHEFSDKAYTLSPSDNQTVNSDTNAPLKNAVKASINLIHAYHEKMLTVEQRQIIDKLVLVCLRPEDIEKNMQAFAAELAPVWRQVDGNDLDALAECCGRAFQKRTWIHANFNGNGRLSTCLYINVIIASKRPGESILLRHPGDRDNEQSSYSKAVDGMDNNPLLMKDHLKLRLQDLAEGKIYQDNELKSVIEHRIQTSKLIYSFQSEFPNFNLNKYLNEEMQKSYYTAYMALLSQGKFVEMSSYSNTSSLLCLTYLVPAMTDKLQRLRNANKPTPTITAPAPVQKSYTVKDQQTIFAKLELLTGLKGWKSNATNGLKIWLEFDSNADKAAIDKHVATLNDTGALKAIHKTSAKNTSILWLENINPSKLELFDPSKVLLEAPSVRLAKAANQ